MIIENKASQKITKLETENENLKLIVSKFDNEINRLYKLILEANQYIENSLLLDNFSIIKLKKILDKANEVQNEFK